MKTNGQALKMSQAACGVPGGAMPADDLPDAVTFFVTRAERSMVLRALRGIDPDRSRALLRALGVAADMAKTTV